MFNPADPAAAALAARLAADPLILAPMMGVTDAAYHRRVYARGCTLAFAAVVDVREACTREVDAAADAGSAATGDICWGFAAPALDEPPVAVQLLGSAPEQFGRAAAAIVDRLGARLVLLDVNMACPVAPVMRLGAGCALMADASRAAACLEQVRRAVPDTLPVTCKFRTGLTAWDGDVLGFAHAMESAGASGLIVHARTADQMYGGRADWSVIARVAEHVGVLVVGSGDVVFAADAVRMLRETGAAGVCIARGSFGDPWIFEQAHELLRGGGGSAMLNEKPGERDFAAALEQACSGVVGCEHDRAQAGRLQALTRWYAERKAGSEGGE